MAPSRPSGGTHRATCAHLAVVPAVRPQPLLCVRSVSRSSRWYQAVLGAPSGHGGDEYERIVLDGGLLLQLHALTVDHHHGALADPSKPLGNGVAAWFEVGAKARVEKPIHPNPNAGHRELWLRDPDGYLVVLAGR